MYSTPPKTMVQTRSMRNDELDRGKQEQPLLVPNTVPKILQKADVKHTSSDVGSHVKCERPLLTVPSTALSERSKKSSNRTTSSKAAHKARLEYKAAQEKAKIQMELIDKKLAAELADLDEECSVKSDVNSNHEVEKWLERSHQELETQLAPEHGQTSGAQCLPAAAGNENGTVHLLASALKDLATASANKGSNAGLLSRMCAPRDLPSFDGEAMEWLHFKQAYNESSLLCEFSAQENLWRLRKCLRGAARQSVSALLISATTPEMVMSALELQFGNPDVILSRIMTDIHKLSPLSNDYHREIVSFSVKVQNCVAAVSVIGREEYLVATNIISSILSKLPTVLLAKWTDYSYPLSTEGKRPTLTTLSDFFKTEALKANSMALITQNHLNHIHKRKSNELAFSKPVLVNKHDNKTTDNKCKFCRTSYHNILDCRKFNKSLIKDRWAFAKRNRICFKCLLSTHARDVCPANACDRDNCGKPHHRLLHYNAQVNNTATEHTDERSRSPPSEQDVVAAQQHAQPSEAASVTHMNTTNCKVLLKVVRVNLISPKGVISAYALLDDGSSVSLISADLTSRLGLRGSRNRLCISGAWEGDELTCDTDIVRLKISSGENNYELYAHSVKELNLPTQNLNVVHCNKYSHLINLNLEYCNENVKPELLIGQDNYNLIMPIEFRKGKVNEPCATLTPLGWCIHGRVPGSSSNARHSTLLLRIGGGGGDLDAREEQRQMLQQLHEQVNNSFTIESMGASGKVRLNDEDVRAINHLENTAVLLDGKWNVGLPWRDPNCGMPYSKTSALNRFKSVERKMFLNPQFAEKYKERIQHLFLNDFAEEVTNCESTNKTWYLPHFAVDNPNKKKLRLVFDAAAKSNGLSLNNYILKGPDILTSLFGIMLRFREFKVAIIGDIKDMFLKIKILPVDQDVLRFLWRNDQSGPVKTFKMTSLIFGANCSPFIAQFVRNKNAERFIHTMPAAVEAIKKQHYMDDYIDSQPDEQTCTELAKHVSHIHNKGNFLICNWMSNNMNVLNSLPNDLLANNAVKIKIGQELDCERTLGLLWYPLEDTLGFDVSFKRIPLNIMNGARPTKREALAVIMSVFDVYGFLSPFTINGKIILQETWKCNINWDETLNDNIYEKWLAWLNNLKLIGDIRIPRCYQSETECARVTETEHRLSSAHAPNAARASSGRYDNLELHIFSDASTQAMCAVAYWRWTDNGIVKVAFVASKCRVAPVKFTTVPRLELQAALLAARLADTIQSEHRIKATRRVFWCDSTTVLQWIRNNNRNYKVYVAHRLGEIDELTEISEWRYIPTHLNVSDIATRESYDMTVLKKEWFSGPEFLYKSEEIWPADITLGSQGAVSQDVECVATLKVVSEPIYFPNPERFSSWLRLVRSTAAVLKFIDKCKRLLTSDGMIIARAETLIIKYSQSQTFKSDIENIKNGKCLHKDSKLLSLSPFLDSHGVLRVGGRINVAVDVPIDLKQPVILDGKQYISRLIVQQYHVRAGHGNQELVVNELKQKYWFIKLRPTVKYVVSKCLICRIKKTKPEMPRMGDLPAGRVAHHQRPFTHCGVDLFGPIEVTVGRRHEKRYGVLFTCLTIRAVHIEIVNSLTTDSLLMALRRMASRRGWPHYLYSDNGTNLRGAHSELIKSVRGLDEEVLKANACNYGTEWTFIPPASPHWGGAWERLIRSVKVTLAVVLKERAPRDEVLSTLLAEVENVVNSRPLSHVSVEVGSRESLTPNHFLIGSSSNLPVLGYFDNSDLFLRKQWRISQALADMFWRRWVREILPEMVPRRKWQTEVQLPIEVGDIVFIADPDAPRGCWPRGIVEATFPGKDGRVRVVAVRTASGTFKRSVARVARIPVESECCQASTRVGNVGDTD